VNLTAGAHLQDLSGDERMILKWIFNACVSEGVSEDWTDLAYDMVKWQAVVDIVMNIRVPSNAENFLTSRGFKSFSGGTLLHGVSLFAC
jgi:hypothetical protein